MALLEQWQKIAYNEKTDRGELQRFWQRYFLLEKGVYEKLLTNPDEKVEGTVKELADKYNLSVMEMTGFLDGINDSLVEPNPIDTMEEDTKVSLAFDKEKLYKNMVDAKADWLYELPQWKEIFDDEKFYELWAYNIETVMAEKVETILRRGVFNTRPRDFYDAYILTTTQKFDKFVFAEALSATAKHRGTAEQIADVPGILHNIEESLELRAMWDKYRKQFAYAADIEFKQIIEILKTLVA